MIKTYQDFVLSLKSAKNELSRSFQRVFSCNCQKHTFSAWHVTVDFMNSARALEAKPDAMRAVADPRRMNP